MNCGTQNSQIIFQEIVQSWNWPCEKVALKPLSFLIALVVIVMVKLESKVIDMFGVITELMVEPLATWIWNIYCTVDVEYMMELCNL